MATDEPWYAVRSVVESAAGGTFEERITLWKAASMEDALIKGENEARRYAAEHGYLFTGFIEVFHLAAEHVVEGTEIFSLLRDSELPASEYISKHFDTGKERRRRSAV